MFAIQPENELGQVVGADAEKVGHVRDLAGSLYCLRCFDHRPDLGCGPAVHNSPEHVAHRTHLVRTRDHRDENAELDLRTGIRDGGKLSSQGLRRPEKQFDPSIAGSMKERRGLVAAEIEQANSRSLALEVVEDRSQESDMLPARGPPR